MIDHMAIRVRDYERSKAFYSACLAPLGITLAMEGVSGAGFRRDMIPAFWIGLGEPFLGLHIAFQSPDRESVDRFYEAAMATGATDNGPPGLRPHYHFHYYGAFVLDPDGYNIEAVCHRPPSP